MLDHPVGGCLTESFGILVDDGFLIVVCLRIIDESFAVALNLGKGCVVAVVESLLPRVSTFIRSSC